MIAFTIKVGANVSVLCSEQIKHNIITNVLWIVNEADVLPNPFPESDVYIFKLPDVPKITKVFVSHRDTI